jgi:phenylalanyl-tRNA synthetase beta chain
MKLSLKLLNNFLNLDGISPEELAEKLTMRSFEVEEISHVGHDLKGPILIGKILDIQKHPNADRLSVTKVTTDGKNELQIVCGAKNISVGQVIPVSLDGAEVVNRQDGSKLKIKKAKIRDIESNGMLCSSGELGIVDGEESGILILSEESPIGEDVINYLSLHKDIVLEVAARSNRGDALSVYGLSKEVSALTGRKLKDLNLKEPSFSKDVEVIQAKIEKTEDTYVFYTATIENIVIKESPRWLKSILTSCGVRSINNIVDITNYINFTYGQPMHAYDKSKLIGKTLNARMSAKGEKITTLDGKERELKEGVLIIADEKSPQAVAGVMGGLDSEVSSTTKTIVFEAAVFSPFKVRRGARAVGLTSEASKRFERGVDSNFTYKAMLKAIEMTLELASDPACPPKVSIISKAGDPVKKELTVKLPKKEIKRVLGIDVETKTIIDLLEPLEFKITEVKDALDIKIPDHRQQDVQRPIDLIEEIARLYGYDNIPVEAPPSVSSNSKVNSEIEKLKSHFLSSGFSEVYLSSLVGDQITNIKEFPFNFDVAIKMSNPLSKEHSVLRQMLIPGLIETLRLNQNHQAAFIRLFEIGRTYFIDKEQKPSDKDTGVNEIQNISGLAFGEKETWLKEKKSKLDYERVFFEVKGIVEGLFAKNHIDYDFERVDLGFLHPSYSLKLLLKVNNKVENIGFIGCLHPKLEKKLDFTGPVAVFEIKLPSILEQFKKQKFFKKISSMPVVERDLTVDISKSFDSSQVTNSLKSILSTFVLDIGIVSIYELGNDNKSLTYRISMQGEEETLASKQIEDEVNKLKAHLTSNFEAKFRG